MWLYRLTNTTNGKAYIGTTVNPISHRVSRHVYAAKSGRTDMAIAEAIRKYGISVFLVECIGESEDYTELLAMEAREIKQQNTLCPNGYNITEGGMGGRRACSPETRSRISARTKGRKPWNYGNRAPSTLLKLAHRGRKAGHPIGKTAWNKGRKMGPMSEAQKQQIAATMRQIRATRFWSTYKTSTSEVPI